VGFRCARGPHLLISPSHTILLALIPSRPCDLEPQVARGIIWQRVGVGQPCACAWHRLAIFVDSNLYLGGFRFENVLVNEIQKFNIVIMNRK
jgi:hypothetical protein